MWAPRERGARPPEEWVHLRALTALDEEPAVAPAEGQEGASGLRAQQWGRSGRGPQPPSAQAGGVVGASQGSPGPCEPSCPV